MLSCNVLWLIFFKLITDLFWSELNCFSGCLSAFCFDRNVCPLNSKISYIIWIHFRMYSVTFEMPIILILQTYIWGYLHMLLFFWQHIHWWLIMYWKFWHEFLVAIFSRLIKLCLCRCSHKTLSAFFKTGVSFLFTHVFRASKGRSFSCNTGA